nr:hypothetical protein CFP56_38413 [Quercus suber]
MGNVASISLIFAANVSLFTSTTKIRGALNGLDSLMIGWDFGLSEILIVVVEFETTASFERDVSINEESILQNLDSITDVTSSCSISMFSCTISLLPPSVEATMLDSLLLAISFSLHAG